MNTLHIKKNTQDLGENDFSQRSKIILSITLVSIGVIVNTYIFSIGKHVDVLNEVELARHIGGIIAVLFVVMVFAFIPTAIKYLFSRKRIFGDAILFFSVCFIILTFIVSLASNDKNQYISTDGNNESSLIDD